MPAKTRKNMKKLHNKTSKKVSKRVLEMWKDPKPIWGKNKPLEHWWNGLASGKYVVVVYKNGTHKNIMLPKSPLRKNTELLNRFDEDKDIIAVLSSGMSQDIMNCIYIPKPKINRWRK